MSSKDVTFSLWWSAMTCGTTTIQFKTNQGKFEAIVVTSTDHIALCVISHSDQYLLHCHKKCTVSQSNGTTIGQYRVEHRVTGCYDIVAHIPKECLRLEDQSYKVKVCFSILKSGEELSSETVHTYRLMEKLFKDQSTADITFHFDGFSETVTAHKLILSQCNYFKTMFESEFTEGGPGSKEITVQEVKPADFELMIKFIYLGILEPKAVTLYNNNPSLTIASWEGVYIAADYYQIDDLRKIAFAVMVTQLETSTAVVDFLFRTARLYPELRTRVIKHIAMELRDQFLKKEVRDKYILFPEYSEILGELYEETFRALDLK
ncbi:hypothetical protein CPB97_011156 [Podila verticillata]|nr:hypothetical protein CPB97_011156 [Podila verticillata]